MPDGSIIIPTYNERGNLSTLVEEIERTLKNTFSFEIIIVDDDSPDETWRVAQNLCETRPYLKVIRRTEGRSLSGAVIEGFQQAEGKILAVMDADLQHPPSKLLELYEAVNNKADIAIGSRYAKGGRIENWPIHRRMMAVGARFLAEVMVPGARYVKDPLSGFFMLRRKVIEGIKLKPSGYKILLEILGRGKYETIVEIPFTFRNRSWGSSSLTTQEYLKFLAHVGKLSWDTGEVNRFIRFCVVGMSGVVVNMGILWFLTDIIGMFYLVSSVVAVECAILSNFTWNELWTFRDRRQPGFLSLLMRIGKFNVVSAGGLVINISILGALTGLLGVYYLLANLFGIAGALLWNFGMNTKWTWRYDEAKQKKF